MFSLPGKTTTHRYINNTFLSLPFWSQVNGWWGQIAWLSAVVTYDVGQGSWAAGAGTLSCM